MNSVNLPFKTFINNLITSTTQDFSISNENIKKLDNELFNLLQNDKDNLECHAKSFFTFDQQLSERRYNPNNQNLNKNYEFIFSGCSQTHGDHITPPTAPNGNIDYIWGFQIAKKYNKDVLNLGLGGRSAETILKGLLSHFQKNGNPKVLLVLYPDFGRMTFVDNEKIISEHLLNKVELIQHFFIDPLDEIKYEKFSKSPHYAHNVLPWTQALYHNLQSILILNQYCKNNNIYFKYSSWDYDSNIILKLLKKYLLEYNNYVEPSILNFLGMQKIHSEFNIDCHEDIKNNYPSEIWHNGIDKEHMGIHQHIHIAEQFVKEIDNDNPWN